MWKEWTNKIRNFAEDITSPDFDESRYSGGDEFDRGDVESEGVIASHRLPCYQRPNAHHRGEIGITHATAYGGINSGVLYGGGARASPLETPMRSLILQYDEPAVKECASAGGSADAVFRAESSQLSAVAAPSSPSPSANLLAATAGAAVHPSGSAGQPMASLQAAVVTLRNGASRTPSEASGDGAVQGVLSSPGGAQRASLHLGERRGPPQAITTPRTQLVASQRSPPQLSALPSSPSAAPMPSPPEATCEEEVTPSRATTAASAARLAQQQSLPVQAQMQLQRVAAVESEKAQMLIDIKKYQEEVRAAHEQAAQSYEAKRREAAAASAQHANVPQEIDAIPAALQVAVSELDGEKTVKTALEARVGSLQREAGELRARLAAAEEEAAVLAPTAAAAATAALAPPKTCGTTSASAEENCCPRHSEEFERLPKAVHEKKSPLTAQVTHLECAEENCPSLEGRLPEAQTQKTAHIAVSHEKCADAEREEWQHQLQHEVNRLKRELEGERNRATTTQVLVEDAQRQKEVLAARLSYTQAAVESEASALVQTPLSALASTATAVTPVAQEKQWQRLVDKLAREERQRGVLEHEIQQLKEMADQLQFTLDRREHEHAAALAEAQAKAQAALADKLNVVEGQMMRGSHAYREELHHLQTQLEREQERGKTLEADKQAAQDAHVAAEAQAAAVEHRCRAIEAKLETLQQQAKRHEEEERERQHQEWQRMAAAESKESDADLSVAVLAQVKRELEAKVQALERAMDQLRRMTVDTLVRLGVDLEDIIQEVHTLSGGAERRRAKYGGADDDADRDDEEDCVGARTELPLLQLFSSLTEKCLQQHSIVLRAERVQQEWEQTYEQARQVNDTLNQQMADAWGIIGKLREELSVKEEALRQMQARVESGDARLFEVQEEVAGAMHELQALREEREEWAARLQQSESGAESQGNTISSLQEELHTLQRMLQEKEGELQASLQSNENLQHVLDKFQENKQHDVEVLTFESQLEAEELKNQLAAARRITDQHASELSGLRQDFVRQLAAKDAAVTTMHRKLAEMRQALERTTSRHMDSSETSIDRRVISQILAKYVHAFIEQRREAEDMLKVLSGLLDWDEATQELVGLLPGPNNPQPLGIRSSQQGSGHQGLLRWLRSEANSSVPQPAATSADGAARTRKAGLAVKWVEFLLKESEGSRTGATATPLASSTSHSGQGSQPKLSFSSPPPSVAVATVTPEAAAGNETP